MPENNQSDRIARLETWRDGHQDQCKERYDNILKGQQAANQNMQAGFAKLEDSIKVVHERVSDVDKRYRNRFVTIFMAVISFLSATLVAAIGYYLTTIGP